MPITLNASTHRAGAGISARLAERGRQLKPEGRSALYMPGNHNGLQTASIRRIRLIAGLVTLFSTGLVPLPSRAGTINTITAGGYTFINFDGPNSGLSAGTGTNINGIANNGDAVGFAIGNSGDFTNFIRNQTGTFTTLNVNSTAMANGINSAGDTVGTQNGAVFFLPPGGSAATLTAPGATAFGINDKGNIVGQYAAGAGSSPGFFLASSAGNGLVTTRALGSERCQCAGSQQQRACGGFLSRCRWTRPRLAGESILGAKRQPSRNCDCRPDYP